MSGVACFLGLATPPFPRGLNQASAPQFWGFSSIYAYLYPLTQNEHVSHGNTRGL